MWKKRLMKGIDKMFIDKKNALKKKILSAWKTTCSDFDVRISDISEHFDCSMVEAKRILDTFVAEGAVVKKGDYYSLVKE